ncbi:hypothetical protein MNBD_ALPHA03-297 [hydrothermal vent metagenome]|uniref:Thiol:disulfide interchange protein DsbD N-terminal domain-containing protein n=1 Tax=hydrothermal vent metagenome TaxID=652676 RepID=A0A3B1B7E4_9ZZZZ
MNMKRTALISAFAVMILSPLLAGNASANNISSSWIIDQYTKSRLFVGGYDKEKKRLYLGWQITLKDGWKTYWRSPGDAGLPPRWTWTENRNIQKITVTWPAPKLLHIFGMDTYVYYHEVILPINLQVSDVTKPTSIALNLEYMICAEICIPKEGRYRLDIPDLDHIDVSFFQKAQLDRHRALVPTIISGDTINVRLDSNRKNIILIELPADFKPVDDIIIEGSDGLLFGRPRLGDITDKHRFTASYSADQAITGQQLTLTLLLADGTARETTVTVQPPQSN